MINKIKSYLKFDKYFLKSSIIVFAGSMIVNVLNYVFHLILGRNLGPSGYGIAVSLISLLAIFSIPLGSVNTLVVNFTSEENGKKEYGKIAYIFKKLSIYSIYIGIFLSIIIILFSSNISSYLKIDSMYIKIISLYMIFALLYTVSKGIIQGLQKFTAYSITIVSEVFFKILIFLIFFYLGYQILGVSYALLGHTIIAFIISLFFIKNIIKIKPEFFDVKKLFKYFSYTFFVFSFLTALTYFDVVMVKHYFTDIDAGLYAALATSGKIILFLAMPIILVMFPMISQNYAKKQKFFRIFAQSSLAILLISLLVLLFYYFMPEFVINILYGKDYLSISQYLFRFGFSMFLFTLVDLLVYYFLAIKKLVFLVFIIISLLLEVSLIYFFHSSIGQIINNLIYTFSFLLFSLLAIFLIDNMEKIKKVFYEKRT